MTKHDILKNRAIHWLTHENTSGEEPVFSYLKGTDMVFNDNSAADEICDVMTEAGEEAGYFVTPRDLVLAAIDAQEEIVAKAH